MNQWNLIIKEYGLKINMSQCLKSSQIYLSEKLKFRMENLEKYDTIPNSFNL